MDIKYHWCNNVPGKILSLNLEAECGARIHMDATLALKRREITSASLASILLQHPWLTAKVAGTIYWQALMLWIKRNPIYDHPRHAQATLDDPALSRLKTPD